MPKSLVVELVIYLFFKLSQEACDLACGHMG